MIKDDYIVRIWPSGTLTMGKADISEFSADNRLMFKSLESYSNEGGVYKGSIYGYVDDSSYSPTQHIKHRLATPVEIQVFHLYGLNKKEDEIKQLYRQIILEEILESYL